ncbi:MAG TPA: peptide chain release factor-like protein [bacterium]|nr:peptide chain release factor-like protein [bacterium]
MVIFSVSPDKAKALQDRMSALGIRECDLREGFVRSSGRGGQNVNKVSTCVHIKHLPTGVEVKCGSERSQALNRYIARRRLADKIDEMVRGRASDERQRIEKLRRQKRRRSRRSKERMLELKKRQGQKKESRKEVRRDGDV